MKNISWENAVEILQKADGAWVNAYDNIPEFHRISFVDDTIVFSFEKEEIVIDKKNNGDSVRIENTHMLLYNEEFAYLMVYPLFPQDLERF